MLKKEAPKRAASALRGVVETEPSCSEAEYGAAAYWLGEAYGQQGLKNRQLEVWRTGVNVFDSSAHLMDVRVADAFIHRVFREERTSDYERAAQAYLELLHRVGQIQKGEPARRLAQHLRLTAFVLPASFRKEVGLAKEVRLSTVVDLPERAGERLVEWWRDQDPIPSTEMNERLREHLARVAYADRHYEKDGRIDDRGEVYVRLGPPFRQTSVRFNGSEFREAVLSGASRFNGATFEQGEFWSYDHISRATQYLFVENDHGVYTQGTVRSMLPSSLQRFSSSYRGQEEAEAFVRAMDEAYEQLAIYSQRYHAQYRQFANYVMDLNEGRGEQRLGGNQTPRAIAVRMRSRVEAENRQLRKDRSRSTPRVFSTDGTETSTLPIAVDHARFLDSDGKTRVEISWSLPSAALHSAGSGNQPSHLISTTLLQRNLQGKRIMSRSYNHAIATKGCQRNAVPPRTYQIRGKNQPFQFDLQWDHYSVQEEYKSSDERLGRTTHQSDTIRMLPSDSSELVMSDLQLMVVPEGKDDPAFNQAVPYPYDAAPIEATLFLYFELYHLGLDAKNRTQYRLEYEATHRTEQNFFGRLFGKSDIERTSTTTEYSGRNRRTEEYIQLDLEGVSEKPQVTDLTLRVTDEVTGQEVQRSIEVTLVSSNEAPS